MAVLKVDSLCKKYDQKATDYTVKNINFNVEKGEIVGLIGHNGAGKTTILKSIMGMYAFNEGDVQICGHSIKSNPVEAKRNFGFVTDNHAVFLKMTGLQYLAFMADIYQVPAEVRQQRVDELQKIFVLGDAINRLIGTYSHGMKQKICMMGSLMHQPDLWILDEPMVGLDPRTAKAVVDYMKAYAALGHAVLFSSHNLDTVEKVCDRVVIIKKGDLVENLDVKTFAQTKDAKDLEEYFLHE